MEVPQKIPPPLEGDENGYEAWLRYRPESGAAHGREYAEMLCTVSGEVPPVAFKELERAAFAICGGKPIRLEEGGSVRFLLIDRMESVGEEGYWILQNGDTLEIRACSAAGLLYGTFRLIKEIQLGKRLRGMDIKSSPKCPLRVLNHWDDPKFDHTIGPFNVTRGFAGNSIFNWNDLLEENPRYTDYARLLASIGINAVCLNNVNADPDVLESGYLPGIRAMADRLRPYNIRIFLSVPFTAPMVCDGTPGDKEYGNEYPFCMRNRKVRLGTLPTADPLDPQVRNWWDRKADEIYGMIPDFGGYVIKASSEGMPGPQDYGRTHAEGANCLARSLSRHGGVLFYRTFVYDWGKQAETAKSRPREDAGCQSFNQFKPLDGQFDDNVIVQTKAGPADFRSHEPPHPLLGAIPNSRQAVEFMIAQEYLGHTTHVCYQGKDWQKILNFDTCRSGKGTTIHKVVSGDVEGYRSGAIVGVSNMGDDANWFGHLLAGANLYAFGSLAWDAETMADEIISDWARRTFGMEKDAACRVVARILGESYDVYARYTVPLGMNIMHEKAHHFEPRIDKWHPATWNPEGAGNNRSGPQNGSFLSLYEKEAGEHWQLPETTPLPQLLFFHHLEWSYRLPDGRTLARYIREDRIKAVEEVREWLSLWRALKDDLNPQTWAHVYERLQRQYVHAGKWRDAGLKALEQVGQLHPEHDSVRSEVLV